MSQSQNGKLSQKIPSCLSNRKYSFMESASQRSMINSINGITGSPSIWRRIKDAYIKGISTRVGEAPGMRHLLSVHCYFHLQMYSE